MKSAYVFKTPNIFLPKVRQLNRPAYHLSLRVKIMTGKGGHVFHLFGGKKGHVCRLFGGKNVNQGLNKR